MDFTPFQAPASDHDPFHTGLSAEKGVTPKNFVEGVNAYFTHVFEVLKGEVAHAVEVVDDDARTALLHLAEHVTSLEQKMDAVLATLVGMAAQPAPTAGTPLSPNPLSAAAIPLPNQQPQSIGVAGALQDALNKATSQ